MGFGSLDSVDYGSRNPYILRYSQAEVSKAVVECNFANQAIAGTRSSASPEAEAVIENGNGVSARKIQKAVSRLEPALVLVVHHLASIVFRDYPLKLF